MMIVDAGEGIGKLGLVETGISHKVRYDWSRLAFVPRLDMIGQDWH